MPILKLPHRVHHIRRLRTLLGAEGATLYFAYGANLNRAHMSRHCAHAEPIGRAVLQDHRLVFHGYADILPASGQIVTGGLWRIWKSDEAALDRYEGFPLLYRKVELPVELDHGEEVTAMLYRMNHGQPAPPLPAYLEMIRRGYRDFELPTEPLDAALAEARRPLLRRFPHLRRQPQLP